MPSLNARFHKEEGEGSQNSGLKGDGGRFVKIGKRRDLFELPLSWHHCCRYLRSGMCSEGCERGGGAGERTSSVHNCTLLLV